MAARKTSGPLISLGLSPAPQPSPSFWNDPIDDIVRPDAETRARGLALRFRRRHEAPCLAADRDDRDLCRRHAPSSQPVGDQRGRRDDAAETRHGSQERVDVPGHLRTVLRLAVKERAHEAAAGRQIGRPLDPLILRAEFDDARRQRGGVGGDPRRTGRLLVGFLGGKAAPPSDRPICPFDDDSDRRMARRHAGTRGQRAVAIGRGRVTQRLEAGNQTACTHDTDIAPSVSARTMREMSLAEPDRRAPAEQLSGLFSIAHRSR